jgi:3-hydroxybutyryl-CoA dehydrogenase
MNVDDIRRIGIIGGGTMGSGLAQEFATAGYDVTLQDIDDGQLAAAMTRIRQNLDLLAAHDLVDNADVDAIIERTTCVRSATEAASSADMVIEAATEKVDVKQDIFRTLAKNAPAHAILASSTSAIHPDVLAEATDCPDRVIVTHFGFPNYLLPLVEVARAQATSDETTTTVCALLEGIGKKVVVMKKPLPGFIVNRLQMALMREALNIVSQGAVDPEDIDTAVQNSFGRRYAVAGPLAVFDLTSLPVLINVANQTVPHLETSDKPFDYVKERVAAGKLGPSTGEGVFKWTPETEDALRRQLTEGLVAVEKWRRGRGI